LDILDGTPLNGPIEIRGKVKEIKRRKVVIESRLIANGQVCATSEVVAVQVPEALMPPPPNEQNLKIFIRIDLDQCNGRRLLLVSHPGRINSFK
jgi:hypothetical protein